MSPPHNVFPGRLLENGNWSRCWLWLRSTLRDTGQKSQEEWNTRKHDGGACRGAGAVGTKVQVCGSTEAQSILGERGINARTWYGHITHTVPTAGSARVTDWISLFTRTADGNCHWRFRPINPMCSLPVVRYRLIDLDRRQKRNAVICSASSLVLAGSVSHLCERDSGWSVNTPAWLAQR